MKIANYEIKNKSIKNVAETLSDNGFNPHWEKNDESGDWYLGMNDEGCEAIYIPSHDGFGEQVEDCFLNDCDKGKDIIWELGRYSNRVIYVKKQYAEDMTEEEMDFLCKNDEY